MKVQNSVLAPLFNRLDMPIRFIYVNTGSVSEFLNKLLFWKLYTSNFTHLNKRFTEMYEFLSAYGFDASGKTVLELGPGNSYINAYKYLINGASKVFLVDKYPRYIKSFRQQEFFKQEVGFIKEQINPSALNFLKENEEINSEYIQLIPKDLTETEGLHADLVYSISVLEHVKDVEGNLQKINEILKPGGYLYHRIDLRDHYNFMEPFMFYKYSDRVWDNYVTKEGTSYTNRLRYDDWMDVFQRKGFKVVAEKTEKEPTKVPKKMDEKFMNKSKENLCVSVLEIILQKL